VDTHQRQFDKGLEELQRKIVHMAAVAETMIDNAINELVTRDEHVADRIPEYEEDLNRTQIEADELALVLLATQQPVARDLRFIMAATKINSELERIGDLVVNITENVHILNQQPRLKPLIDIPRMADLARKMVRESVQALLGTDTALAQAVILGDDEVDGLKEQVLRELLTYMIADPRAIERAIALILISRHLERIADHATNIAQNIIYMVEGRDVRHPKTPREEPPAAGRP